MREGYWLPWEDGGEPDERGRECVRYLASRFPKRWRRRAFEAVHRLLGWLWQQAN